MGLIKTIIFDYGHLLNWFLALGWVFLHATVYRGRIPILIGAGAVVLGVFALQILHVYQIV